MEVPGQRLVTFPDEVYQNAGSWRYARPSQQDYGPRRSMSAASPGPREPHRDPFDKTGQGGTDI